jgi:hypothetical protein
MAFDTNAMAAVASAVAAFTSLVVTIYVSREQPKWASKAEEEREKQVNRRKIKLFIEDVSEAFCAVYARTVFDNQLLPRHSPEQILDAANWPEDVAHALSTLEESLLLFEEDVADRLKAALRSARRFQASCKRIAQQLRDAKGSDDVGRALEHFAYIRGALSSAIQATGRDLVAYGATAYAWHGLPDTHYED